MTADEIRKLVTSMWLTTPEAELLACIALALAQILESLQPMPLVSRTFSGARTAS